jgi:uncharacterized protein YdeI (YjbR/CyaY-like superfamily)
LRELRTIVHEACPEVQETVKWSFPHFEYKGLLCSMASFKEHCAFGFWKGGLVLGDKHRSDGGMGQFGRITSLEELPPRRVLLQYVRKAAELNDKGIKVEKAKSRGVKRELAVPDYLLVAVKKNKKALATFLAFPYSKKKDYVEWVGEAKTDETRERRLKTAIEWMAQGKSRNWKYEKR